ncbi:hypothetical protein TNCV_1627991 [Trichonephila clavipes]|nr:hypothetical protein TNCV_1627991 [Trichonephila clavipes]
MPIPEGVWKFQNELQSSISDYRDIYKKLSNRPSSPKFLSFFMVPKNKSIEIVSSSDERGFEVIHHRKMNTLDYDEQQ